MAKTQGALAATATSSVVWPMIKAIFAEIKRHAWDERGTKSRAFLGFASAGIAFFGSQGAGIAALGGAIGVPLWLVLGGGGVLLATLYEELSKPQVPENESLATGFYQTPQRSETLGSELEKAEIVDIQVKEDLAISVMPLDAMPCDGVVQVGDSIVCLSCGKTKSVGISDVQVAC